MYCIFPWDFPSKNTGEGYHFLLQGIFLTQGLNPCLPCLMHWQVDSLPLSHLGIPKKSNRMIDTKCNKRHRGVLSSSACFIFQKGIVSAWMPVLLGFMNIYTDIHIPSLYNFVYMNSSIIEQSQSFNYQNN